MPVWVHLVAAIVLLCVAVACLDRRTFAAQVLGVVVGAFAVWLIAAAVIP